LDLEWREDIKVLTESINLAATLEDTIAQQQAEISVLQMKRVYLDAFSHLVTIYHMYEILMRNIQRRKAQFIKQWRGYVPIESLYSTTNNVGRKYMRTKYFEFFIGRQYAPVRVSLLWHILSQWRHEQHEQTLVKLNSNLKAWGTFNDSPDYVELKDDLHATRVYMGITPKERDNSRQRNSLPRKRGKRGAAQKELDAIQKAEDLLSFLHERSARCPSRDLKRGRGRYGRSP
jgi:hypothetical protein